MIRTIIEDAVAALSRPFDYASDIRPGAVLIATLAATAALVEFQYLFETTETTSHLKYSYSIGLSLSIPSDASWGQIYLAFFGLWAQVHVGFCLIAATIRGVGSIGLKILPFQLGISVAVFIVLFVCFWIVRKIVGSYSTDDGVGYAAFLIFLVVYPFMTERPKPEDISQ